MEYLKLSFPDRFRNNKKIIMSEEIFKEMNENNICRSATNKGTASVAYLIIIAVRLKLKSNPEGIILL
jgi:hypothetical protein